jgi:hypothetical protein
MEQMYQDYKDVAEFRIVYINEAHAADGRAPVGYAREKGIMEHADYGERCSVAQMMLKEKKLTIPCVIDKMDNKVNEAYQGWPDRVFLVRTDGRLAVAAKRGPWGFKPGVKQASAWLAAYRETGVEPDIVVPEEEPASRPAGKPVSARHAAMVVGAWDMETVLGDNVMEAVMTVAFEDGRLSGVWSSQGREMEMTDLAFDGERLTFTRSIGPEMVVTFEGRVDGDRVEGTYSGAFGELESTGTRREEATTQPAEPG